MISILISTFNCVDTIEACLSSVLADPFPDKEIIVVDGGSTDGTLDVIRRLGEGAACPFSLHFDEGRGLGYARNLGVELARGEYVAFTDADCEVAPGWLAALHERAQAEECGGVGGRVLTAPTSDFWGRCVAALLMGRSVEHSIALDSINMDNALYRRDVLLAIGGFDPRFTRYGEDADLNWRLTDAGHRLVYAPEAVVWHRYRSTWPAFVRWRLAAGRAWARLRRKWGARTDYYVINRLVTVAGTVYLLALLAALFVGWPLFAALLLVGVLGAVAARRKTRQVLQIFAEGWRQFESPGQRLLAMLVLFPLGLALDLLTLAGMVWEWRAAPAENGGSGE